MDLGHYLAQQDLTNPCLQYFSHFGSITLNKQEAWFSQAKLEIYGLYYALQALKLWIIGTQNLVVEMDMQYMKGMLHHPNIAPSTVINRWILAILTFYFELVYVPDKVHGPDSLL